jgi:DNA-binding MurR/RpiR family transcriptional regulator
MKRTARKTGTLPANVVKRTDVTELLRRLSRKRQVLIQPIFENPRDYVLLSVRGLARKVKRDPATTLRIVRGMGFPTYHNFQQYLHNLSIVHATPLQFMEAVTTPNSNTLSRMQACLDRDIRGLNDLKRSIDFRRIIKLVDRLYSSRTILVIGGDQASTLVKFLEYNLAMLQLPVVAAVGPGEIVHRVRSLEKGDTVVAISYGRGLRQTVEGMQQAHSRRAHCIGITDTPISPVARLSHDCYLTSVESPAFGGSYVAPMAFLNTLLVACANVRRKRSLEILREMEKEQRSGFRWYSDSKPKNGD